MEAPRRRFRFPPLRLWIGLAVWPLASLALLSSPAAAVQSLFPRKLLEVEFELSPPPFFCAPDPCVPDLLDLIVGPLEIVSGYEVESRLFVDDVLLGTWTRSALGATPGPASLWLGGSWMDAASPFAGTRDAALVDFTSVRAGSTNARIEVRLTTGQIDFEDGFASAKVQLAQAISAGGLAGVAPAPTLVSIEVVDDPEAPPEQLFVDATGSAPDAAPGDGICATAAGECTLTAAVEESNASGLLQTVIVPAGTYPASVAVTDSLEIEGAGLGVTVIQGDGASRVFDVVDTDLLLSHVSVTGGQATGPGGGVRVTGGLLLLDHVDLYGNQASGDGGGIWLDGDSLVLTSESVVRDNTAGGNGGGIHASEGLVDLVTTFVSGNTAPSGAGGGLSATGFFGLLVLDTCEVVDNSATTGGGIWIQGAIGLTLQTRIHLNQASAGGGGVFSDAGDLALDESTVDANTSSAGGGGAEATGFGFFEIAQTTLAGNTGTTGGGAYVRGGAQALVHGSTIARNQATNGGGLGIDTGMGTSLTIDNSAVAENQASGSGPDCLQLGAPVALSSAGHNLIGDASDCGFTSGVGDLVGSAGAPLDPLLGPLEGTPDPLIPPALTPLPGSPLIDTGSPEVPDSSETSCSLFDQLFVQRPVDGDGDGEARCDIGSVERNPRRVPALSPLMLGLAALALAATSARRLRRRRLASYR